LRCLPRGLLMTDPEALLHIHLPDSHASAPARASASVAASSTIDVLLDEPLGVVSPDLYGYLLENLGTAIYDGVWVGEDSGIPNVKGIRKALIDALRDMKASVIRWP